jgi:K+-transporting ATPase ATPase B chain
MEIRNKMRMSQSTVLDPAILLPAIGQSFVKLNPRVLIKNPVMFVVEIVAALTTVIFIRDLITGGSGHLGFTFQIILWLWVTVLFANFAEAVAEGRGKAQAATLRRARTETAAKRLPSLKAENWQAVSAPELKQGDIVLVEAGDFIPSDGDVVEGIASVDESAITGESAPVIRESGGDRSAVTGGTRVLSDWIKVRITATQGSTFLDVAKYFAMIPAMFIAFYPQLQALNVMRLGNPESAILSAIIFNALIIVALIPLALRGVAYRPIGAAAILRRNLLLYGVGGIIVPFVGIKLIDMIVTSIGLA